MCACAVDRAVRSAHGSTVDRPLKTKGYAIRVVHARSKGPGRVRAGCGGEHAGVRRRAAELAGIAPGRRSRPSTRPQASAKRRGDACAHDRGVKGGDRASSTTGAGRGQSDRSGELVSTPLGTERREKRVGVISHRDVQNQKRQRERK
jgi:hypothetical protein